MAAAIAPDGAQRHASQTISVGKARCSEFILVANEAVQMHGDIGMTDEHDIGFYLKREPTHRQQQPPPPFFAGDAAKGDGCVNLPISAVRLAARAS